LIESVHEHPDIPPAPRQVTPIASRRAWGDLRVRFWWICAAVIAAMMLIFAIERISSSIGERRLIATGILVHAKVTGINESRRPGYTLPRNDSLDVQLSVDLPDGQHIETKGVLPPADSVVRIGDYIDIRILPSDPSRWTDRTEMISWPAELFLPLVLLPIVCLLLVIAIIRRRQVLRIWRTGYMARGVVLEVKQSPIAPLSRLVRYTISDLRDKRVFGTLIPAREGIPEVGDTIPLVALPDDSGRAVVAKLYR
jgi:4-amino-4-deoxy-L-arabinose transferase-like glycosyltransferase